MNLTFFWHASIYTYYTKSIFTIIIIQFSRLLNEGAYSDFGEFMARDPYFTSMQSSNASIVGRPVVNNSSINQSFPTIGTFTLESTSPQSNQIFSQPDFYNNSTSNGINGGNNAPNSSAPYGNNTNNNSSSSNDPNQATRETGIIEKLLVCIRTY